jgi:hypothetical protein
LPAFPVFSQTHIELCSTQQTQRLERALECSLVATSLTKI